MAKLHGEHLAKRVQYDDGVLLGHAVDAVQDALVDQSHFIILLIQSYEVQVRFFSLFVFKILSQEIDGSGPEYGFFNSCKGKVKTGHGFEKIHDRAVAGGHDNPEDGKQPVLSRAFFAIRPVGCDTVHHAVFG